MARHGFGKGEYRYFRYPLPDTIGGLRAALMDAVDHHAALVSYSPEQEMQTWWERALIPFVYCRLAAKFSFARVNDPARPDAAANGQFLFVRRDAYDEVGGHAEVRGEILEDVAVARLVKQPMPICSWPRSIRRKLLASLMIF